MNDRNARYPVRAGAVLLLGLSLSLPLHAAPPPQEAHELCRTLVRSLDDGAALSVERCWTIRFIAQGSATRIEGTQSRVAVDAPPALAPLAQMEENRVEDGIFPLVLGADGLVFDGDDIVAGESLAEARTAAAAIIAQIEPDPEAANAMRGFVAQVASASARYMGRIPRDLFYPVASEGPETIRVSLPDGSTGSVIIEQSAVTAPATGLLVTAQRSVVTRAGGTTSEAVETWVLTPAE